MDQSSSGPSVDSDLSESWTLLEKEFSEIDESTLAEGTESTREDDVQTEAEVNQNISIVSVGKDDAAPFESSENPQNEGTESIDSDGISIISESEEEELKLLPCSSTITEDRPCSRSSNKYFDETDTASQCSTGTQEVLVTQSRKKYKHQPNNNLNTSLNVLLVISWAAVIGLGMGHFLGLQEECSSGHSLDEKIKNDTENEELSVLLLKKLELENTALKEQFSHLQKMIEELGQKNTMPTCKEDTNSISATGNEGDSNLDDSEWPECQLGSPNIQYKSNEMHRDEDEDKLRTDDLETKVDEDDRVSQSNAESPELSDRINAASITDSVQNVNKNSDDEEKTVPEEDTIFNKNEILQRLEQSLEDVAILFNNKLNPNKISFESSKEALSSTITVLSGLLENLKEKVNGIKNSLDSDSLSFDKPFKAITKMEEVLQKTSEKVQKITESAFKEGKPLFAISNKITSKLQAINRKLEEKWCQVKRNLSKQSVIWSWLDNQIFQNCTEDDKIISNGNRGQSKPISKEDFPEEQPEGKRFIDKGNPPREKIIESSRNEKKIREDKSDVEYKNKRNDYKNSILGFDKTKDRYKRDDYVNPHSFDTRPTKRYNKENERPSQYKAEATPSNKKKPDSKGTKNILVQNFEIVGGKNGGKYSKGLSMNKSGEWVEALFNHRAERRRDERRSDWFFARARSRSRTREREAQPSRWYLRRGENHSKI